MNPRTAAATGALVAVLCMLGAYAGEYHLPGLFVGAGYLVSSVLAAWAAFEKGWNTGHDAVIDSLRVELRVNGNVVIPAAPLGKFTVQDDLPRYQSPGQLEPLDH